MVREWTADEAEQLIRLKLTGILSWDEIGVALGRPRGSVRRKFQRLQRAGEILPELAPVEIDEVDEEVHKLFRPEYDGRKRKKPSWRDLLNIAMSTKEAFDDIEIAEDIRNVELKGDPPPIIVYSGDWHLGSRATDYVRWFFEMTLLLKTPNTFLIDLGDDRENMRSFRHLRAVIAQVLPPELQAQLVVGVVKEYAEKRKLLAKVGGTHDLDFDERIAGEMLLKYLYDQESIRFFKNKGLLNVIVDFPNEKREFPNLLFHKSRYSSFLSTLHANRREYQLTFPGKVVAGAHNHEPGAEIYYHYPLMEKMGYPIGGFSWNIKVGPFVDESRFFSDLGSFYHGTSTFCPACVYTEQGIVLLPTLRDALAYRASLEGANQFVIDFVADLDIEEDQRENLLKTLKLG